MRALLVLFIILLPLLSQAAVMGLATLSTGAGGSNEGLMARSGPIPLTALAISPAPRRDS